MKRHARGASLLIPVLIFITVASFAVVVAASLSGGDVRTSDYQADSIQALLIAETGIERALKRYASGDAGCTGPGLQETITDLDEIELGTTRYQLVISAGLATDFSSVALVSSQTQCRLRVTATVLASGISRTLHAIVDRNLLQGSSNYNFNQQIAGAPTAWTFSPAGSFQNNGSPDSPCNRAARIWIHTGIALPNRAIASGSTTLPSSPVAVTVEDGSITTVSYHKRFVNRPNNCPNWVNAPGTFECTAAAGNGATICFRMQGAAGWSSVLDNMVNGTTTLGGGTACPYAPAGCSTNYSPAYPGKFSVQMTTPGAGPARRPVTQFEYSMRLQDTAGYTAAREMVMDNIEAVNNTALDAARVVLWRDCSTVQAPPTGTPNRCPNT